MGKYKKEVKILKKILILLITLFFIPPPVSYADVIDGKCPKSMQLLTTKEEDKEELILALQGIIPKVYGSNPEHKEWVIEIIQQMPKLSGFEKNYYKMAINFCGKDVADHTWFVRLRFPRLLPAQSASLGEIYIVKDTQHKWFAWFQYH